MLFITLRFSHLEEKFLTVEGRKLGVVAHPFDWLFKTDSEYVQISANSNSATV